MSKASEFADKLSNTQAERDSLNEAVTTIIKHRSVCECGGLGLFVVTNEGNLNIARIGAGYEFARPGDALKLGKWLVDMFGE